MLRKHRKNITLPARKQKQNNRLYQKLAAKVVTNGLKMQ